MARGLNKVMIIGNLGRDPEMRYTPNGTPVTSFSVAVGRSWTTPDGERKEATEWFNVVSWRDLAEICNQYLRKGGRVYIEGSLQTPKLGGPERAAPLSNRVSGGPDDYARRQNDVPGERSFVNLRTMAQITGARDRGAAKNCFPPHSAKRCPGE